MKAKLLEPDFYEVVDGEAWYTASLNIDGSWFVMNHRGTLILQGSAIHRRVVEAIDALS